VELVGERRESVDVADIREAEEIDVENEGSGRKRTSRRQVLV
jgi:hypothetical protein